MSTIGLCVVCATPKRPTAAEIGLLCSTDANHILQLLRHIAALAPALDARPVSSSEQRHTPGYASVPPCRLDVVDQTDPRSRSAQDEGPSALAALCSWSRIVSLERDVTQPARITVAGETTFLRTHHSWICRQPWVDDYATELRAVRDRLRALTGLSPDAPVGSCMVVGCGGPVYPTAERDGVQCRWCQRLYTGLDLARLHIAQDVA